MIFSALASMTPSTKSFSKSNVNGGMFSGVGQSSNKVADCWSCGDMTITASSSVSVSSSVSTSVSASASASASVSACYCV
ncbi:hypothetical protein DLAC_10329 [Tieghemostelium lacteum]|uniref:Uncharacterized protein n=1 Tax=Tieghemostelium lacteum TaxID=361077 RepID=A0A151Z586_TIELA|nr:hypothetical protein DLAC_10329 [Tieghemostelium lacteum]|eukprot:KYQ89098.1 hypothetical protein DLAC_10329 [Tieghemostelium lacteum]